jgi:transposase
MSKSKRKFVSEADFVTAHFESNSNKEVAEKLGIKESSVSTRASQYRAKGIPLKRMPTGGVNSGRKGVDVEAALKLIEKLQAEKAAKAEKPAQSTDKVAEPVLA